MLRHNLAEALLADAAERARRYLASRRAMRISISGWATSDDDIDRSASAIVAALALLSH